MSALNAIPLSNRDLVDVDRDHLIHPVSMLREHERRGVTILESGRGMWLKDASGHELLDAFAGLWCVNIGYGHESVVEAAAAQMRKLPYATGYFDFGSEAAIRLAQRLTEIAPASLTRVYFTLGGSDAVDSAIRFIVHYFNSTGRPQKKQFISLERGYHGSSSSGAGLTALPAFHHNFDLPRAWQHYIPSPYPYRSPVGGDPKAVIEHSVAALKGKVAELGGPEQVAAFFCEPIQGSGGVIVPPDGWLRAMRAACTELGVLFVADEVITGFGRTGPMFACDHEGVTPDVMTIAKGLTAGYSPMGAVMLSEEIYEGLAAGSIEGPVGHGFTYSGHPVSAAVGLEVLRLYFDGGILANGQAVAPAFAEGLRRLGGHPLVGDHRGRGLLGALELVADKASKRRFDPDLTLPDRLFQRAYANGVIVRSFSDGAVGFAPALCCSRGEMELIFERVARTLDDLLEEPDIRAAMSK